jgi:hypothetical protein
MGLFGWKTTCAVRMRMVLAHAEGRRFSTPVMLLLGDYMCMRTPYCTPLACACTHPRPRSRWRLRILAAIAQLVECPPGIAISKRTQVRVSLRRDISGGIELWRISGMEGKSHPTSGPSAFVCQLHVVFVVFRLVTVVATCRHCASNVIIN